MFTRTWRLRLTRYRRQACFNHFLPSNEYYTRISSTRIRVISYFPCRIAIVLSDEGTRATPKNGCLDWDTRLVGWVGGQAICFVFGLALFFLDILLFSDIGVFGGV